MINIFIYYCGYYIYKINYLIIKNGVFIDVKIKWNKDENEIFNLFQ
jgi:hypothetical protein